MTNREFFVAVSNGNITDEIKAFALESITKLDKRNAQRATKPTKTQLENEPIKVSIVEFISTNTKIASEIATALNISTQKVSALCKQLVDNGQLVSKTVKVKGKGEVKAYSLAVTVEE